MDWVFPEINHIDQVLKAIENDKNFIVVSKPGYKVINYVLIGNDTFPNITSEEDALRRECRGIVFNENGRVISRRFHKFFNLNEREETNHEVIEWDKPHVVLEKIDGSMVAPFELDDGKIIWGTKMGETDFSHPITSYVEKNPQYGVFASWAIANGLTPIFEWVSTKQRIVLGYPEDKLILIALRGNVTGFYVPYNRMVDLGKQFGLPVVKAHQVDLSSGKHHDFINKLSKEENTEGVVIRFDNGHMIKIKTEWYVRLHKTKEAISVERYLVELILNNQLDDLIPFMLEDDKNKTLQYQNSILNRVDFVTNLVKEVVIENKNSTKKEYALKTDNDLYSKILRNFVFKFFGNDNYDEIKSYVIDYVKKHCTSGSRFDTLKEWFFEGVNLND